MLLRLLRSHLPPHRWRIIAILLLQLAQTLATLYLPTLNADIINVGVVGSDTPYILRTGGLMVLVTAVQIACAIAAVQLGATVAMAVGRDIRREVFERVQDFSAVEMARFGASSLLTRTTNDVQQVQTMVVMALTLLLVAPITCLGGIVLALRQDVYSGLVLLVAVPLLATGVALVLSRLNPQFRRMQVQLDRLNHILREQITGVRVIRAFVRDGFERRRFGTANTEISDVSLRVGRLMALMYPTVLVVMNGASIVVLALGAHRIADGRMGVGSLTAFLTYLVLILMSVMNATFMLLTVPRATAGAARVVEVTDTRPSATLPDSPVTAPITEGTVAMRGVGFRYPQAEQAVLTGIDLVARHGRTTAIVGRTGSGKTTLVNLIPRLADPSTGTVHIDGQDVRTLAPRVLSSAIGLVPQRPYLFAGTIATNLRYGGPDATDEDLWHALEIAQARDFVAAMPDGLDSPIAQGGTNISGGQRQRLAIARALVRKRRIYLFDDSFSALDYATDAALRAALADETADATIIVVAQRITTVRDAHQIVVLDAGQVVGAGTHDELMDTNDTYREIVFSQQTELETAR